MPEYKTLKVPIKVYEVFEKYIQNYATVYENATTMIHDIIKEKAKELLIKMNPDLSH
jgi:hypothetical protein